MKKYILLSIVLLFAMGSIQAQEAKLVKSENNLSTASESLVGWKYLKHDFGKIPQGEPVTILFPFTNHTNEVIFLDNVRTSCGCTAPTWTKDPILPGETNEIELTYNSKTSGAFVKTAKVFFRDVKEPQTIVIKGDVIPEKASSGE